MITITNAEAAARIRDYAERGLLVKHEWHKGEAACLLGSLHPDIRDPADCPANIGPLWFRKLTVSLFDALDDARILPVAREFALAVEAMPLRTEEDLDAIKIKHLKRCVQMALDAMHPEVDAQWWRDCRDVCVAFVDSDGKPKAARAAWAVEAARAARAAKAAWAVEAAKAAWAVEAAKAAWAAWDARAAEVALAVEAARAAEAAEELFTALLKDIQSGLA